MKTQEQIEKETKTLDEMGNIEMVRWFMAKPDPKGEMKTWHQIPIDDAKKMITYCVNSRIDFSVDFEHNIEDKK